MWWNDTWSTYGPMPWMFFGPLTMLIFLGVCVAVMYLVMRGAAHGAPREQALGILKERFARGEIDQSEFEQRRRVLLS